MSFNTPPGANSSSDDLPIGRPGADGDTLRRWEEAEREDPG